MGYLRKYARKYYKLFFLAVLFLSVEALCDLLQPVMMSRIVDVGIKNRNLNYVLRAGAAMVGITAVGAVGAVVRNNISSRVSQRFGADLRFDLFSKIQGLSVETAGRFDPASLVTRLTNDVTQMQNFVNGMMRIFVKSPLLCIGSIVLAVALEPHLSLILVFLVPLVALIVWLNNRVGFPFFQRVQRAVDRLNGATREYLSGVRVVKAFNRSAYEEGRFAKASGKLMDAQTSAMRVSAIFSPSTAMAVNLGIAAVLWFGSFAVDSGSVQVGKVIAFINYMTQISSSLLMISAVFTMFVRARASAGRIGEVMSAPSERAVPAPSSRENQAEPFAPSRAKNPCAGNEEVTAADPIRPASGAAGRAVPAPSSRENQAESDASSRAGNPCAKDNAETSAGPIRPAAAQPPCAGDNAETSAGPIRPAAVQPPCAGDNAETSAGPIRPAAVQPPCAKDNAETSAGPIRPAAAQPPCAGDQIIIAAGPIRPAAPQGLEFRDVWFSYRGTEGDERSALRGVSFQIRPGETLGIIGTTGSGKSTLASLIPRFYDVTSGAVLVDGEDVRAWDLHRLRGRIAVVPQRSTLFTGSILENIRWGKPGATLAEAEEAAELAQIHDFVASRPEGYDTPLGQGGVNLSGGQKQRLALARALVKKPSLLILDDCTSAVDAITEQKIREGLRAVSEGLLCVTIAQRIASVREADLILVLDDGRACGCGKHAELLEGCRVYRELALSQFGKEAP